MPLLSRTACVLVPSLALFAWSPPSSGTDEIPAETTQQADSSDPDTVATTAGSPDPARMRNDGMGRADTASTQSEVPLTPGVYVLARTSCENPANAAWRVWDGEGLSGSATESCRAEVLSRSGDSYTIRNSCVNTYDGSRTPETLTLRVPDQVHFTVNGNAFESCSTAQVPKFLRNRLQG